MYILNERFSSFSLDIYTDIDEQAQKMYDELVQAFAKEEGCNEQLKATNQMLWIRKMNNATQRAREVINAELIYNYGLLTTIPLRISLIC